MSHGITETDQMFSVRQPTWHGLGVVLPEHPTREEAQALVHPWEPVEVPLFTHEQAITPDGDLHEGFKEVEEYKAYVRSDDGGMLGVVGQSYQAVSNTLLWDIAEAVQGSGVDVRYETAGSLYGGRKVWVMLRLEEPLTVKGDPHGATVPYYVLQNAHDGSRAFRGQATVMRVVCANTARIADLDASARGTSLVFHHSRNVEQRIEDARHALQGWRQSLQDWKDMSEAMMRIGVSAAGERNFLDAFIPMPAPGTASERVRDNVRRAQEDWRGIYESMTCEGITGTVYGLVQTSVEYAEHYRAAQSQESRFKRSYLDTNRVVSDAVTLAHEVAGA